MGLGVAQQHPQEKGATDGFSGNTAEMWGPAPWGLAQPCCRDPWGRQRGSSCAEAALTLPPAPHQAYCWFFFGEIPQPARGNICFAFLS